MKRFAFVAAWLACACVPAVFAADTIESVQKAIIEKSEKITSIQFKSVSTSDMNTPQYSAKTESESTVEAAKKGDAWLLHAEAKTKSSQKVGDQEMKNDANTLMICDGKFNYILNESQGQKQAMKMAISENMSMISNKHFFDTLAKDYDLKLLPDEQAEGKDTWTIEAAPKKAPMEGMAAKMKFHFDKDNGMTIKVVGLDAAGKTVTSTINKDIKLNASIPDDHFVFKAPEGVTVMDMTAMQQQAAQPAEEPKSKPEGDK